MQLPLRTDEPECGYGKWSASGSIDNKYCVDNLSRNGEGTREHSFNTLFSNLVFVGELNELEQNYPCLGAFSNVLVNFLPLFSYFKLCVML